MSVCFTPVKGGGLRINEYDGCALRGTDNRLIGELLRRRPFRNQLRHAGRCGVAYAFYSTIIPQAQS